MTADEIRQLAEPQRSDPTGAFGTLRVLAEIAAQLAELNAQLKKWDNSNESEDASAISVDA